MRLMKLNFNLNEDFEICKRAVKRGQKVSSPPQVPFSIEITIDLAKKTDLAKTNRQLIDAH